MYKRTTGRAYLGVRPSKKSIRRMVEKVHALTSISGTMQATTQLVDQLNRALRGWGELLPSRHRPASLSRARQLHGCAVTSVVAPQAQSQATAGRDLSTLAPVRVLQARTPGRARACPVVGDGVMSCPRAGCGRSASPVR
jgi:hypothetical protein